MANSGLGSGQQLLAADFGHSVVRCSSGLSTSLNAAKNKFSSVPTRHPKPGRSFFCNFSYLNFGDHIGHDAI
jgi:hypothetical protein